MDGLIPRAKKSLGQNFLVDDNICRKIVDAVDAGPGDRVVEIGPGQGALTRFLDATGAEVLALEKDVELAGLLEGRFRNVVVQSGDALDFDWDGLAPDLAAGARLKLCGNLPYNVASRLIWDLVSMVGHYERAVFMVQWEVGGRLTAEPGTKAYGALTAWVRNYAETRMLFKVPPSVFRPRPKVDSGVVLFTPRDDLPKAPDFLSALISLCFQRRRKQLGNILRPFWGPRVWQWFQDAGIPTTFRPENLTPGQFRSLSEAIGPRILVK